MFLDSLLLLSSTSLLLKARKDTIGHLQDRSQAAQIQGESVIEAAASTMDRVCLFLTNEPFSWPASEDIPRTISESSPPANKIEGLGLAVSWLVLRLSEF